MSDLAREAQEAELAKPLEGQRWERVTDAALDLTRIEKTADGKRLRVPGTLATNGEASDGHILDIDGLEVPERMPFMWSHYPSESIPVLGSVVEPRKSARGKLSRLRAVHEINIDGDDPLAAIRRGVANLVESGDIGALSIRWIPTKPPVPRRNLASDHPAAVKHDEEDPVKRWGLYFPASRAQEGSLVPLGADPKALIGRAADVSDGMAAAWMRHFARSLESDDAEGFEDALRISGLVSEAALLLREMQLDPQAEALLGVASGLDQALVPYHYGDGEQVLLPRKAWESLFTESREEFRAALELRRSVPTKPEPAREPEVSSVSPSRHPAKSPETDVNIAELVELVRDAVTVRPEAIEKTARDAVALVTGRRW